MVNSLLKPEETDRALRGALDYARRHDYAGHSKHDALNSPVLGALSLGLRIPRICLIQGVMRAPVDLRALLGVRRVRNNKGIALFARALLDRGRALACEDDLAEARLLLDWLVGHAVNHSAQLGWGYPYPWQDLGFFAPRGLPNRVVTSFVAQALMEGYEVLQEPRYLEAVGGAVRFLLDAPTRLVDSADHLCLSYVPDERATWVVLDVSILVGAVVARYSALSGDASRLGDARRLVGYVVDKQTDYHAWYYCHPPGGSHITHDNYHTGFILDGLHAYMRHSEDYEWAEVYRKGLSFYRDRLFEADGAPRWMHDKPFPRDIHGSAQGIISFVGAARDDELGGLQYRELAHRAARWALEHMWMPELGRFAWQKTPHGLRKHDLLRWCQGWMARAMGALLLYETERARATRRDEHTPTREAVSAGVTG